MNYTHLIWDFNGTIYDDVDAGIRSANRLLSAHGLPTIREKEVYLKLFGFPIIEYYQRLGFDLNKTPFADLAVEWVAYYLEESKDCTLYPDIPAVLEHVRANGIRQLILSATEREMLLKQLDDLGIRALFDEVLGLSDIHAYSKEEIGTAWRKQHPDARVLMFGDTDHDAEVAKAIGADCVLLTCGHQAREVLEKMPCLFVADSASDAIDRLFGNHV